MCNCIETLNEIISPMGIEILTCEDDRGTIRPRLHAIRSPRALTPAVVTAAYCPVCGEHYTTGEAARAGS